MRCNCDWWVSSELKPSQLLSKDWRVVRAKVESYPTLQGIPLECLKDSEFKVEHDMQMMQHGEPRATDSPLSGASKGKYTRVL